MNYFREWAHTHYEVVCFLEILQQDLDNPPSGLEVVLNENRVSAIYDLSIDLTNEFMDLYNNAEHWRVGWIETIQAFINKKLL
jgi:hypothetical protein